MMPSVSELAYFLEVSNTLNLSHAARNLKISQPSLSRAMQSLEHTVGTELFIRHKKGVTLTAAGMRVLRQVKPLIQSWQNTKWQALASHENMEGEIKIGCHAAVGMFIHDILAELLETYPKLSVDLLQGSSDEISQNVNDLKCAMGLVAGEVNQAELVVRKLKDIEMTLWVSEGDYRLQDVRSGEAVLICDAGIKNGDALLSQCKHAGVGVKRLLKANNTNVIANLTVNGCGVGILPVCYVQALYRDKLRVVSGAPVFKDSLSLIYRQEYANIKVIQVVLNAIKLWVEASACLSE